MTEPSLLVRCHDSAVQASFGWKPDPDWPGHVMPDENRITMVFDTGLGLEDRPDKGCLLIRLDVDRGLIEDAALPLTEYLSRCVTEEARIYFGQEQISVLVPPEKVLRAIYSLGIDRG